MTQHLVTSIIEGNAQTRVVSDPKDLKRCTHCVMPETRDVIQFNEDGVCNSCCNIELKNQIDWDAKKKEFEVLLDQYRGKYDYDCIVPFSGGKDSTFTIYSLIKDFGLKPLVLCFDHQLMRPKVLENRERTLKRLGVDFLGFRPDWNVVKKTMRIALERKGDIFWYQHNGIFAYPTSMAIKLNVPLIIWGEPTSEYSGYYSYDEEEEMDERKFNMYINLGIRAEDMLGMINEHPKFKNDGVTMRDMAPYVFPKRKVFKGAEIKAVMLGKYIPWDVKKQYKLIHDDLGWEGDEVEGVSPEYCYEKIEDMMQGVQDYLKFIKRGFGRMSHLASIDIRNGRMTREEGVKLIEKWEGLRPGSLDVFLKWMNMSEDEFYKITCRHAVSPWKHDPLKTKRGKKLWDQDLWVVE